MSDSLPLDPAGTAERPRTLTLRGATVLGIGSMIGAGIFALLGEAGAVAGAAVWISFLIGGIVALLLGYVCAKLGMRYPSSGGLITYLVKGFGVGRLVGIASWLGYIAAIVIVTAMVAVSFGGYATALFVGENASAHWDNVFITLVLVVMLVLTWSARRSLLQRSRRSCSACSGPSWSS
jgi:amino acid transporter